VINTECLHIQNLTTYAVKKTRENKEKNFGCFNWKII